MQFFERGRQKEDKRPVGTALHHVQRALRVDLQEDVLTRRATLFNRRERRAVVVAVHIRILEKRTVGNHLFKLFARAKIVFAALLFPRTRRARSRGNRVGNAALTRKQFLADRPLSRARCPRDHDEKSLFHSAASFVMRPAIVSG